MITLYLTQQSCSGDTHSGEICTFSDIETCIDEVKKFIPNVEVIDITRKTREMVIFQADFTKYGFDDSVVDLYCADTPQLEHNPKDLRKVFNV